jgi:hypothetical protein
MLVGNAHDHTDQTPLAWVSGIFPRSAFRIKMILVVDAIEYKPCAGTTYSDLKITGRLEGEPIFPYQAYRSGFGDIFDGRQTGCVYFIVIQFGRVIRCNIGQTRSARAIGIVEIPGDGITFPHTRGIGHNKPGIKYARELNNAEEHQQ